MLISPIMDLLVISGSGFLLIGGVLKAISVATRYHPQILGFSSVALTTTQVQHGEHVTVENRNRRLDVRRRQSSNEREQSEKAYRNVGSDAA